MYQSTEVNTSQTVSIDGKLESARTERPDQMGRGVQGNLQFRRVRYFNCASAPLIFSKFGNWPGLSLDSA